MQKRDYYAENKFFKDVDYCILNCYFFNWIKFYSNWINNLFNFLSFSLFSTSLTGRSFGVSEAGSDFSVSGISTDSSFMDSFLESSGSGVGLDFFFLNLAK